MKSKISGIVLATLAGAALFVAPSVEASASTQSVGCYGDYCSGQDPMGTNCAADAYTVASAGVYGTYGQQYVEIRWSPTCKTNWARANFPTGNIKAVQETGYTAGYGDSNGSVSWSRMIYSPVLRVKAVIWGAWGVTETAYV
jgi:hypothetical protein